MRCCPVTRSGTSHNHDVSDHAYEQRGILHCVLETPAGKVHCYVVHLGLFEGSRGARPMP
jgi:endonuclease/exonuclease/phosphatase family metal-dependent hydrolase